MSSYVHYNEYAARTYPIDRSSPIFFWKPEEPETGYLGQWYPSVFTSPTGNTYENAEQYMMHSKGVLFDPSSLITAEILEPGNSPKTTKALGRGIANFDEKVWKSERLKIVVDGNYLKFTQDEKLKDLLLGTGEKELVEASPRDRIWGIGFGAKNAEANRRRWGTNLLGLALMDVRDRIRKEEEAKTKV